MKRLVALTLAVVVLSLLLAPQWPVSGAAESGPGPVLPSGTAATRLVTITLPAARDNTLYQSSLGTVSNGQGEHFFAGTTASGSIRRGLLAFDVAGALPAAATVVTATLELSMSRSIAGAGPVHLHLAERAWGEGSSNALGQEGAGAAAAAGDATWLHAFFSTDLWQKPGGDFRTAASASTQVGGTGRYQWQSAQLAADVQGWLDDPETANGWFVIGEESSAATARRFGARENSGAASRPALVITYTLPQSETPVYLPLVRRP
jgi:hypothetical protein